MKANYVYTLCAALFAATLWLSCDEPTNCNFGPYVGSIQIDFASDNDTLVFLPNDSASMTVTIIVKDTYGEPYPGLKVAISLSDSNLGILEFLDPALQDTTNSLGRVNAVFRSFARNGDQIITATAGGITAQRILFIREAEPSVDTVTFESDCDSLIASPEPPDSCEICVTVRDANNDPVVGVSLIMSATGGRFTIPPITDQYGRSCFYMYLDEGLFGDFCVIVYSDSTCFSIPG